MTASAFKDQNWSKRYTRLGDEAEGVFDRVMGYHGIPVVRYGLNRPDVPLADVTEFVRYTPDFLTPTCLVEVQGVGRDGLLKVKVDKWSALQQWNMFMRTELFIWDKQNQCHIQLHVHDIPMMQAELQRFPEGKPYFEIPLDRIDGDWENLDAQ